MKKKHICLIFAGGTIGMHIDPKTHALRPAKNALEILQKAPELQSVVDLDVEVVVNMDSSNMQPENWTEIAKRIHGLYDKYDGFVVAHGTDTMAYTVSAISFALQNLGKPIAFTGSLIPMGEIGSDARNNLVYACMTVSLDIAEVCIVMANKIFRGNRSKKHHESFVAAFHSPNYPLLGRLGRPIVLHEWCKTRHDAKPVLKANFEPAIAFFKLFPGFNPSMIDRAIEDGAKGIIIEGFGPGNVPSKEKSIIPEIEMAVSKGIPVVIASQMERGITNLESYEAGLMAKRAGAISALDMTTEATVVKLMWALGQGMNLSGVEKVMSQDLAGEVSVNTRYKYYDAL